MSEPLSSYAFWTDASHHVDILDSSMHYLRCGTQGDPILFLHGMPCSSFLWRNILPKLSKKGQCIAPDLIGMGRSGRPEISYTIQDHIRYVEAFISKLELENITLVVHGWGSVVGLDIASRQPERFKALVMCESHLRPVTQPEDLALPVQELMNQLGDGDQRRQAVVEDNFLLDTWLPSYVMKKMSKAEMDAYRFPFGDPKDRDVLLQYINDLPVGSGKDEATRIITNYSTWLCQSELPKLLLYAVPGFITAIDSVSWAQEHIPHLTATEMPESLHFVPETSPDAFAFAVKEWMAS
jgi:haloalkane dehalogenase